MARIRTIKPEFWQSEDMAQVSETARLVAIGLLNIADDEGWFKANPKLVEAAIFPLSDPSVTIQTCITELSNVGYIQVYRGSDSKEYGKVVKFTEHQVINRAKDSKIKELVNITEESLINHGQITDESMQERKGKEQGMEVERKGKEIAAPAVADSVSQVFDHWIQTMGKQGAVKLTAGRKQKIAARLKDGYSVDDIKRAINNCAGSSFHMGKNPEGTVHDDLTLICRSAEKLEFFRDRVGAQPAMQIEYGRINGRPEQEIDILGRNDTNW